MLSDRLFGSCQCFWCSYLVVFKFSLDLLIFVLASSLSIFSFPFKEFEKDQTEKGLEAPIFGCPQESQKYRNRNRMV